MHAIAMWSFDWLERRWAGGGFEDWSRALDELVERGYDAVRIDAYPHFVGRDPVRALPIWPVHGWGSPLPNDLEPVLPSLKEFMTLCAERGVKVGLSSWFRDDTRALRMEIASAADHAEVWLRTLRELGGLLDNVLYLDLCNEWPDTDWAPYVHPTRLSRTDPRITTWQDEVFATVRKEFPGLPLTFSFSHELDTWAEQDVSGYDLLEPHIWLGHTMHEGGFYAELGYDYDDPGQYTLLAEKARALYESDRERWNAELVAKIESLAEWSRVSGKPLMTTECWALIFWKDGPGLDWDWIKDLAEVGIGAAVATGRFTALATSNFCSPQFRGMWDDVAWHRRMTALIKGEPS